jgi:hypothetical protein
MNRHRSLSIPIPAGVALAMLLTARVLAAGASSSLPGLPGRYDPSAPRGQAVGLDLNVFLDKVDAKVGGFQEARNWRGSVTSTITKMDRHWTAESVTVVTKAVTVTDGRRSEEILQALETKDGKTQDITKEFIETDRKEHEKYRRQRPPDKPRPAGTAPRRRGLSASIEDYTPFSEARRKLFEFSLNESASLDGRPALALDVKAKVKSDKNWEGRIYFEPGTLDPLLAEAKPSATPRFVQELEARIALQVLDGKSIMLKSTRIKVNAGFLFFKRVRQVTEDVYSGVELLAP